MFEWSEERQHPYFFSYNDTLTRAPWSERGTVRDAADSEMGRTAGDQPTGAR